MIYVFLNIEFNYSFFKFLFIYNTFSIFFLRVFFVPLDSVDVPGDSQNVGLFLHLNDLVFFIS